MAHWIVDLEIAEKLLPRFVYKINKKDIVFHKHLISSLYIPCEILIDLVALFAMTKPNPLWELYLDGR